MKEVITNSIHPVVYPEPWHRNQHHRNGVCIHKTMTLWPWAPFLTSLQFQSDMWMTWEIQQSFIMTSTSKYFFSLSGLQAWLTICSAHSGSLFKKKKKKKIIKFSKYSGIKFSLKMQWEHSFFKHDPTSNHHPIFTISSDCHGSKTHMGCR